MPALIYTNRFDLSSVKEDRYTEMFEEKCNMKCLRQFGTSKASDEVLRTVLDKALKIREQEEVIKEESENDQRFRPVRGDTNDKSSNT